MLVLAGTNPVGELLTVTLAVAPKVASGQTKQGKNAVKAMVKYFCGENVMSIRKCDE